MTGGRWAGLSVAFCCFETVVNMTAHLLTPPGLHPAPKPSCDYSTIGRRGSTLLRVRAVSVGCEVHVLLCVCEYSALTLNHCSSFRSAGYVTCIIYRIHKQTNEKMRLEKADKVTDLQAGPDMPGIQSIRLPLDWICPI